MSGKMKVPEDYVPVHVRIQKFRKDSPQGLIVTERTDVNEETVAFKAYIYRNLEEATGVGGLKLAAATGHAEKEISDAKDVEKCETTAIGRALGILGYELQGGIASAEDMSDTDSGDGESEDKPARRSKRRRKSTKEDSKKEPEPEAEESEESEEQEEEDTEKKRRSSRREKLRSRRSKKDTEEKEEEESEEQESEDEGESEEEEKEEKSTRKRRRSRRFS